MVLSAVPQPTGEQNVKTAAAQDAVETHRQRGGGQEQSEWWAQWGCFTVHCSGIEEIRGLVDATTVPVH